VIQFRIWGCGKRLLARLAVIAFFCGEATGWARAVEAPTIIAELEASRLSSEGQAWLLNAIATGNSPDLRWPEFSDYSKDESPTSSMGTRNGGSTDWSQPHRRNS